MTIYIISSLIALTLFTAPVVITTIENNQYKTNKELLSQPKAPEHSDVAVIYFSRSGNTAIMANKIAQIHKAKLINIEAPKYELGLKGLAKAAIDSRDHDAEITPRKLDLSPYKKIYLGSPIWFYSPAPPIWAFLANNRFDGIEVILFNSYNSNFGQNYIDEFKSLAINNGASSFKHISVIRGRMGNQLSTVKFLKKVETLITKDAKF